MADFSGVDGAGVLADLNALRKIGAYKSGVHRPTFSEPHVRSLRWLVRDPARGIAYPQMVLRLGYGTPVPATPRRPIEDVVERA